MAWLKVHIFHDQNDDFFSFLFLFHWRERVWQYLLFLENVVNGSGRCFRSREFYCGIIFSNYCLLEIFGVFFFFFFCIGKFHKEKIQLKLTATKNYCQKMAALIKVVDSS